MGTAQEAGERKADSSLLYDRPAPLPGQVNAVHAEADPLHTELGPIRVDGTSQTQQQTKVPPCHALSVTGRVYYGKLRANERNTSAMSTKKKPAAKPACTKTCTCGKPAKATKETTPPKPAKPAKPAKAEKPAVKLFTKVIKKPQEIDLKGLKIKRLVLREDGTLSIGYVK